MDLNLKGKTALITGSTTGIGYGIALSLLREGASVIINGRWPSRVEEGIQKLRQEAPSASAARVEGFIGDLATAADRAKLFKEYPRLDIVINNLGIFTAKNLDALSEEDFTTMYQTNVLSGALISQFYLPGMRQQNWGRVIFIASETGVQVPADMIHYGVSKAAQIALSRGLAETTVGTAVTVNAVLPGPTLTDGVGQFLETLPGQDTQTDRQTKERDFILKARPSSLLQRFATVDEVATLVTYLASPLSSATNGATVRVDGGLLRHAF
jgi:NAD(P)-dependent dehydrogenase (short-subunit alcohol dehydrogenase family)